MVSIVIPVYKVEKYIERCLASVKVQTYSDLQVVVVDDCGNDNSVSIARNYLDSNFTPERYIIVNHKCNRGLSAARNTGVEKSQGEYLYFLDGDDTIAPDCIEMLVKAIQSEEDIDMAMAGIVRKKENQESDFASYKDFTYNDTASIIEAYINQKVAWNAVNRLIRRSCWNKAGVSFTEGVLSEDLLWNFQLLPHIHKIRTISNKTYFYYETAGSIMDTANRTIKFADDYVRIVTLIKETVRQNVSNEYIRYYHYIKYAYIPYSLLWHGYRGYNFNVFIHKLYHDRKTDWLDVMPTYKYFLFKLPMPFIVRLFKCKFNLNNLRDIFQHKLKHIYNRANA